MTPLYVQLAAVLRGQIERGELSGRLPSVKSLQQQYGVAQGTAERAFALLRSEGLVTCPRTRAPGRLVMSQRDALRQALICVSGAIAAACTG